MLCHFSLLLIQQNTFLSLPAQRSIRRNRQYVCKAKTEGACLVDKTHRNQCRACRLKRCIAVGMNKEAVQHERGPRNSTLRRQMSLYFKEHHHPAASISPPPSSSPAAAAAANGGSPSPPSSSSTAAPTVASIISPPPPPPMHTSLQMSPVATTSSGLDFSTTTPLKPPGLSLMGQQPPPPTHQPHPAALPPPPPFPFLMSHRLLLTTPITNNSQSPMLAYFHHPAALPRPNPGGLFAPTPKYPHELSPPPPAAAGSSSPFHASPTPSSQSSSSSPLISSETLSEAAARLLFMNVRWAQNVPAFLSLPYKDQLALLEETWRELFVLSAAQFSLPVEAAAAAAASVVDETTVTVLAELKAFQEAMGKFQAMQVDATEFACLRAIVLLKTSLESSKSDEDAAASPPRELRDQAAVNSLQDQAQLTLSQYVSKAYPLQPQRFGKLLLLLPNLKAVSGKTIHSLFFKCIGSIPLEKIICDMFKARRV